MTCFRCGGLMHLEPITDHFKVCWIWQMVCYLCARRIDRVIIKNKIAQRYGRLQPRLLSWTPKERIKPVVGW